MEPRNYEDETYDLWLAEYPAETGTFDAPSNPVSITAVPADGDGLDSPPKRMPECRHGAFPNQHYRPREVCL